MASHTLGVATTAKLDLDSYRTMYNYGGVGAVVRSLPSNPKVPGSIPGSDETGIFSDLLSR